LRFKRAEQGLREGKLIFFQESPLVARFKSDRSPAGYWEVKGTGQATGEPVSPNPLTGEYKGISGGASNTMIFTVGRQQPLVIVQTYTDLGTQVYQVPFPNTNGFQMAGNSNGLDTFTSLKLNAVPVQTNPLTFKYSLNKNAGTPAIPTLLTFQVGGESYTQEIIVDQPVVGQIQSPAIPAGSSVFIEYRTVGVDARINIVLSVEGLVFVKGVGVGCNCPDKTRIAKANPSSAYTSEQKDRDWTESDAGTPDMCWHEIALQLTVDPEGYQVPTDYPFGKAGVDD
jgi:hypothetical protein